jgi:hypothetical protein
MRKTFIILISIILSSILIISTLFGNNEVKGNKPNQNKQISFTVKCEKIVSTGELFRVIFSVNDYASGFISPAFKGIQVISGPNTLSSQTYSYVNGNTTQLISTSYTYHLIAEKEGKFIIPSAQVTVNGKTYNSEPFEITVVKGENGNNTNNNLNQNNSNSNSENEISDNVFIKTTYSKTNVYPGEFIISTTKIYTKIDIRNLAEKNTPKYTGFWIKDIQAPQNIQAERELLNGQVYSAALLRQTIIYPQKIGKYQIEPYELEVSVKQKVGKEYDIFGRIVDRYAFVNKPVKANSVTITVKPFPEKEPENFSGIVGENFKISASVDKTNLKTDENINYTLRISGNGNLYLLNEGGLKIPDAFDSYKPNVDEAIKYTISGGEGFKEFKYLLLARKYGKVKIEPLEFVYFDIKTNKFETIRTQSFDIDIEKGENYSTVANQGVQVINKDIRYIKEKNITLKQKNKNFGGSSIFYLSYIIALLAFIVFVLIRRKTIKENSDIAKVRNKKAGKISQKRLKTALNLLKANKETPFYSEILKSLNGYLSDKLNLNQNLATKGEITNLLSEKNVNQEYINSILDIMNTCEYAQYGPVGNNKTPESVYAETENIINKMESIL